MIRSPLALVLALVSVWGPAVPASAEEEERPSCGIHALMLSNDIRLLKLYDGVRKGLEHARLPRVCLAEADDTAESAAAFGRRLEAQAREAAEGRAPRPLAFALGDEACVRLHGRAPGIPRVFVTLRWTFARRPAVALPRPAGAAAVVYAELQAETLGDVLRRMLGTASPRVALARPARDPVAAERIASAGGFEWVPARLDAAPQAVLELRGLSTTGDEASDPRILARALGVPLVTDDADPIRFRRGVHVALVPDAELVGRVAAEAARRMYRDPDASLPPRGVPALRVWVNLEAADREGISFPLPFLASADKLHRGIARPPPRREDER